MPDLLVRFVARRNEVLSEIATVFTHGQTRGDFIAFVDAKERLSRKTCRWLPPSCVFVCVCLAGRFYRQRRVAFVFHFFAFILSFSSASAVLIPMQPA